MCIRSRTKRIFSVAAAAVLLCLLWLPSFVGCAAEHPRSAYRIDAAYADGTLTAELAFAYQNDTGTEQRELWFNLYGNAYREGAAYAPVSPSFSARAYYAGESFGGMEVHSVSPCAAWEVCGEDQNILRVRLASPVPAGGSAEVVIAYTLTLARVRHRTGLAGQTVNLGNFYPVLCVWEQGAYRPCVYAQNGDPFYSACADYAVELAVPASYTAAASGQVLSANVSGGQKTYAFSLENARDFAIVLSEAFTVEQLSAGDVTVLYYSYADASPRATAELARDCLLYFSDAFGEYAYSTYSVVQTGFCFGGMEYPALAFVADDLSAEDAAYTLVHETAHQWWYAAVGSDQTLHAWQDEGLAEYSSLLYFEKNEAFGFTREGLLRAAKGMLNAYYSVREQLLGEVDTTMDRPLTAFGEYEYVVIAYAKGELLFDALREALGERRFFAGLRRYYAQYSGKLAAPEQLAASFPGSVAEKIIAAFCNGSAKV